MAMRRVAAKHGHYFDEGKTLTLDDIVTPIQAERLKQHREEMQALCGMAGDYFTCLATSVSHASRTAMIPTLLKDGKVVSLRGEAKLLAIREVLIAQGEALAAGLGGAEYPCFSRRSTRRVWSRTVLSSRWQEIVCTWSRWVRSCSTV